VIVATVTPAAPTRTPPPAPPSWLTALGEGSDAPPAILISCLDTNGDLALTSDDPGVVLPEGLRIPLLPEQACFEPETHADFYPGADFSDDAIACEGVTPVQIVIAASAGSDLKQPQEGESLGLIEIARNIRTQLEERGAEVSISVGVSAIFGADPPQTSMELWQTYRLQRLLEEVPCARAIIIGHSHGGVTATAVATYLDEAYADRLLAVVIDRTAVLYDRIAPEMPARTRVINFYQLNEGWHGFPIDLPNVENIDRSADRAPVAPSDGGGAPAIVSHKTLDDSPEVQRMAVEMAVAWVVGE
jgi:hypothetical protein